MKHGVGECLCLVTTVTALAVQQNRPSLVVVSYWPSSPLRAVDQVVFPRGTGCALELAGRRKLGCPPVSRQLASLAERRSRCSSCRSRRASQPGEKGECRATSIHAWFFCEGQTRLAT